MKIASIISDRRQIVKALEEIMGITAEYLGAPSFGYEVGPYTVDRTGAITAEAIGPDVITALVAKRVIAQPGTDMSITTISFTMEGHDGRSLKNLVYILYSKGALLGKAVGKPGFYKVPEKLISDLELKSPQTLEDFSLALRDTNGGSFEGLSIADGKISFQFPYTTDPDRLRAYTQLAELMVKMAKDLIRVLPEKTKETNEKYIFRCWLMRLGMIGDEYKMARKILLQNLRGHTAFRTKDQAEVAKVKLRAQRAAEKEAASEMAFVTL